METEFENIRDSLSPALQTLTDIQLAQALAARGIPPREMEGFLDDLGKFAMKAAPAVLPVAGGLVGTMVGGPVGAALGSKLGSLAGGAISNLAPPPTPPGPGMAAPAAPSAAGQLLQTVTRPETLQALSSMAMGLMGKQNISVGGTQVPISAFTNLISSLAGRAEAEYNSELAQSAGDVPQYMKTFSKESKGDPNVAVNRAEALYELMEWAAANRPGAEGAESEAEAEALSEWEMEADAAEALEMAEAAEGYESEEA